VKSSYIKILLNFLLGLFVYIPYANATHNRAGEITYKQIGQYTFEVTLITYTDSRSITADRPQITLDWGDGKSETLNRNSQTVVAQFTFKNIYTQRHTYAGPGQYRIKFEDPNRVAGIVNMTNSVGVKFYVETLLIIDPSLGFDQSPVLLRPPIDQACVNRKFDHNPDAYDPDGDSLVFSIIPPKEGENMDVPGYQTPFYTHSFSLDPHTGELVWDSPKKSGIYNIAILVQEFRQGKLVGYIIRDMQINVDDCTENPPVVSKLRDTCVEAGTGLTLRVKVKATDPDIGQLITLTGTGGPFQQTVSPAHMSPHDSLTGPADSVVGNFIWNIACEHIRRQPYQVVFKAQDNFFPDSLADLQVMQIKVVGPPPKNLKATPSGDGIQLNWQKPVCAGSARGYFVYRRADSSHWTPSNCEIGVPGSLGFQLIDTITDVNQVNFFDNNRGASLTPGIDYCYRVTAIYLNAGQFELVEGYASNEACAEIKKDVPVMTHVSVRTTDELNGSIYIDWTKPSDIQLDTIQHPGPYAYKLYRSPGLYGGSWTLLQTSNSNSFSGLNDTTYIDSNLNTQATPYSYKVEFYYQDPNTNQQKLEGSTTSSSSVFLHIHRNHKSLDLSFQYSVPWRNARFVVFKENKLTGNWDVLDTTTKPAYTDTGLILGTTYCYKVESIGSYFAKGFPNPLLNWSQYNCSRPVDTIKPCPPVLEAQANCDEKGSLLNWTIFDSCSKAVTHYKIYYSPLKTNNYNFIDSVSGRDSSSFMDIRKILEHSLAGCYQITALDSFNNESHRSNEVCVDNCPRYELPNVFTPDNDDINDIFTPLANYRFIENSVDMHIYNRWGEEVFSTTDPDIKWDGKDKRSHQPLTDGVYYYICVVKQIYLDGDVPLALKGTITIIRK
jgi:gliding motility-associated-like protein